jgi:uncharacterized membrane protein
MGRTMKTLFRTLGNFVIAGFVFLLPVFVAFQIVTRVWTTLGSVAQRVTHLVGARHILGVEAQTALTGLMLLLICILFGWLVRFSLVGTFHDMIERQLTKYIPGYATYKASAEGKVHRPVRTLPTTSVLVMRSGFWRPGYAIEHDAMGNSVIFLPDVPNTDQGHVLLATKNQVQVLPSVAPNQLDAVLKKLGKGLLSEYALELPSSTTTQ